MRRYDDPVEVRRGWVNGSGTEAQEGPEQFLWRGRLWKVRVVVAQWIETGSWWSGAQARAAQGEPIGAEAGDQGTGVALAPRPVGDLLAERELWRVEASQGAAADSGGVFDLSFSWSDASWRLVGCVD